MAGAVSYKYSSGKDVPPNLVGVPRQHTLRNSFPAYPFQLAGLSTKFMFIPTAYASLD
jgi:hypothetical protein